MEMAAHLLEIKKPKNKKLEVQSSNPILSLEFHLNYQKKILT